MALIKRTGSPPRSRIVMLMPPIYIRHNVLSRKNGLVYHQGQDVGPSIDSSIKRDSSIGPCCGACTKLILTWVPNIGPKLGSTSAFIISTTAKNRRKWLVHSFPS